MAEEIQRFPGRPPGSLNEPKNKGRPKGIPNVKTLGLLNKLKDQGFDTDEGDPILFLCHVYTGKIKLKRTIFKEGGGMEDIETIPSPELKVRCAMEVAKYFHAQRKAIELSGTITIGETPAEAAAQSRRLKDEVRHVIDITEEDNDK